MNTDLNESTLVAAGVPPRVLQLAKQLNISFASLLALIVKFGPLVLQILQDLLDRKEDPVKCKGLSKDLFKQGLAQMLVLAALGSKLTDMTLDDNAVAFVQAAISLQEFDKLLDHLNLG